MNRKTLNRNRRRVISLLTLVALLLPYVPSIGVGEITAAAHSAETAVVDATTATDIAHAENAVVDASFTQVRTWNTIVSTSSSQGPAQRPLRGDVEDCLDGTISYWKLDEAGTPTAFEDFYGDNDGTCSGGTCPTPTTGIISGTMDFDGNDEIDVPDDDSLDWSDTDSFAVEVWVNTTQGDPGNNKVFIGKFRGGSDMAWWLGRGGANEAVLAVGDSDSNYAEVHGTSIINDGVWHHLVGIMDRSNNEIRIYVDGVLENTVSQTYTGDFSGTDPLYIGYYIDSYYYDGLLDEIAIYNRPLTETEIKNHYYLVRGYCDMCDTPIRIMPLGDSITWGNASGVVPADPEYYVSYRKPLWDSLQAAGYDVNFVGALRAGWHYEATEGFDPDNAGYPGAHADGILQMLDDGTPARQGYEGAPGPYLEYYPADVILLHIGTNDISGNDQDVAEVEGILDEIDEYSENITVILARIINRQCCTDSPPCSQCQTTTDFNDAVEAMALARMDSSSPEYTGDKIIIVDLEDGVGIDYHGYPPGDLWDNLHPYETGYAKMADGWLNGDSHGSDGLVNFLPACAPDPTITSDPVTEATVGRLYSYNVDASGYPPPTYTLTIYPTGMTIDENTGLIEWTPAAVGIVDVTVEAINSAGTDTQPFTITVAAAPPCPADMTHYWKLDETTAPYEDFYGSNDATCTDCPAAATGIISGAQQFDGISNAVNVTDDDTFDWGAEDSFSVEYWMNSNVVSSNKVIVGRDDGSLHWWAGIDGNGTVRFQLQDRNGSGAYIGGTGPDIDDGTWHHIVCVRDESADENRVYVDGALIDWATHDYTAGFNSSTELNLGHLNNSYNHNGALDEVALYDRALTEAEILGHYNTGTGRGYCETYAPDIVSTAVTQAFVGAPYSYDVEASGNPPPTYTLATHPTGMTIDENTGEITWTPAATGDYDVTVGASNSEGTATPQVFTIHVANIFIDNLSLTSTSGNDLPTDDLTCNYDLGGTATTAATAWYKDGSPQMLLYMPMEGGSTANALQDYSGSGHSLTNNGATWNYGTGWNGSGGFYFNEDTIYAGEILPENSSYTKMAWVRRTGDDILNILSGSPDSVFWANCGPGNGLGAGHGAGFCEVQDNVDLALNTWYHVAVTYDSATNTFRLYKDGVNIDEALSSTGGASDGGIYVGGYGDGNEWRGYMDEVRIYGHALSTEQIAAIHAQGIDVIVSQETAIDDEWQCRVTPFSDTEAGATYPSNILTIQGTPTAPIIISTPVTDAIVGVPYSYDVDATGYPAPTYALTTYPTGMTIDPATGLIEWTPIAGQEGPNAIVVEATNSEGSGTQPFTINVAAAPVCPADMISYWKLGETGSPTIFEDFYGDNDGACSGGTCPTPIAGIVGGAQDFAEGNRVDVPAPDPDVFDFAADESFSIGYWVNTTQSCVGNKVYIGRSGAGFWLGCGQVDSIGAARFYLSGSGDSNQLTGLSQINDGNWHFIVAGREASAGSDTQFLYVDGVLEDSDTTTDFGDIIGSEQVTFGYFNSGSFYYYAGILDEIAFFRRALTAAEIQGHYNAGTGRGYCETYAPEIVSTAVTQANIGCLYTYDVGASGNPPPTYALTTYPTGMTIDPVTGLISWTPDAAGDYDVTVQASNPEGTDDQSFVVEAKTCPCSINAYYKLDESASPYTDFLGGPDATCTNCPAATTGIVNGAQQFSGDAVNVADEDTFDWGAEDSFSIEYWMNSNPVPSTQVIVGRDDTSTDLHWWTGIGSNHTVRFMLGDKNGNGAYIGGTGPHIDDGAWHHIVCVRDESADENRVYVDGALIDWATHDYTAGFDSGTELNLGHLNDNYNYGGILDEVALYDRALTDTEIQQHHQNGLAGLGYCPEFGSITIVKETDPAGGTGFEFTGDLGDFTLDDGENQVFADQPVGDYDVTEIATGWDLSSVVCTGGDSTPIADGVTIHLDADEDIICTFANEELTCPTDMTHYWKLDETAGAPYEDYYGVNDATCANCPAATAGMVNGAQQFDGISNEVNAADDDTFDWSNSQSFSIEFWARTMSDCDGNEVIVGRDDGGATPLHWWVGCADWLGDSAVFILVDNDGNAGEVDHWPQSSSPMNDGAWHHIVAVRDAAESEIRLYVDGVEEDSSSATYSAGFDAPIPTALNMGHLNSGYSYDGTLDEVALYDRVLSPTEIWEHYDNGVLSLGYCEESPEMDYGDVPDPTYPTLLANNGARHVILPGFFLGVGVDAEPDGQPDATATGDDLDGNDDEDGVTFGSLVLGQQTDVVVTASAPGILNAWIDFDGNGSWADPGEHIFADTLLAGGANNLAFPVPLGALVGQTFARFRFDSVGGLSYDGLATDGEVEDYLVEIVAPGDLTVTKTVDWSGVTPDPGQTFEICINGPSYPSSDCQTADYDGGAVSWIDLIPGDYVVTETDPGSEWTVEIVGSPATVPAGGSASAAVTNTHRLGELSVIKTVEWNGVTPDPGQTFEICITGLSYPSGDCQSADYNGGAVSWDDLIPSDYTVTETDPGSDWVVEITGSPATVPAGGSASAAVTNTHRLGDLTVTKTVEWNGVTPNTSQTFDICITGPSYPSDDCQPADYDGGTVFWNDLIPGDYTVTENDPGSAWTVEITGSPATVPTGGSASAAVTNTHKLGGLSVIKTVDWSGASPDTGQTFEICITGLSYPSGDCQPADYDGDAISWGDLIPGDYTVTETDPGSEWTVEIVGSPATVTEEGSASVSITNTLNLGSLSVTKTVDWNGVTPDPGQTFEICITGLSYPSGNCQSADYDGGAVSWNDLIPGDYTVTETDPGSDWAVEIVGSPATVPAGGSASAAVTNTHRLGDLSVTKTVEWNGVAPDPGQTFEICITGLSYPSGNCQTVAYDGGAVSWDDLIPGDYTVTENDPGSEWAVEIVDSPATVTAGGSASAAVTNTHRLGGLSVIKTVDWSGAAPDTGQTFEICITGLSYPSGDCQPADYDGGVVSWDDLIPGDYTVTETDPGSEWAVEIVGSPATVTEEGSASVSVTNTLNLGSLSVTKTVEWSGVTPDTGQTFEICITGLSYPSGDCQTADYDGGAVSWDDLIPGDYTVTETDPGAIWIVEIVGSPATVPAGDSASASITNTFDVAQLGSITIEKVTDPASGTSFEFDSDLGIFTLGDGESQTFSNLTADDYDVTEIVPTDWDLDSVVCTGGDSTPIADGVTIHLDVNEDITCIFTNKVVESPICPTDMAHYWKLDETSSGSYDDFYGSADGVCAGACPSPTTDGKVSNAQTFSSGTGIDIPDDDSFEWGVDDSFTIEFWMYRPGILSGNEVIVGRQGSTHPEPHVWVGVLDSGLPNFSLYANGSDSATVQGTTDLTQGGWHHVVSVRDADTDQIRLYVDGVEEGSASHTFSNGFETTTALNIGWLNLGGGYHFNGTLDEVALYNRALSETEIKNHYYLARGYCDSCATPVRMMPLGDSITVGMASGASPDDAAHWVSYRKYLWESLGTAGYNVDFVGSESHGYAFDPPFDSDHEGHGGMTDDWIADRVYGYLVDNPADVVLLHIGTNGLNPDPDQVEDILDEIDRYSEDVTVILARITNRRNHVCPNSSTTTTFNDNVEAMAEARIADGDKIIIVDMECGAGLDYSQYPPGDMWDSVHPYATGYAKMSAVWMDALDDFIPVCAPYPTITSDPVTEATVGWPYTYDVDASGNPPPTYTLTVFPAGMTIDENTGLIEWTPAVTGDYDVTVQAANSEGTDTQPFTITVAEAPACPADMTHYWKLDETTGSPYEDFYGANDATCTDCPAATAGMVNGGQLFDGSSDEVNVDDDDTFDWSNSQSFSIEFWARTTSDCDGNEVIVGRDDGGATPLHWWVGCGGSGSTRFYLLDNDGNQIGEVDHWLQSSSPMNDGAWHHIVAVRDAAESEIRLYIDGVEEDSSSATYSAGFDAPISTALNIGHLQSGYNYDGTLDEVALYDRALSAGEIQGHYNAGTGIGYCETCAPDIISTAVIQAFVDVPYSYDVDATGNPAPTYTLTIFPTGMTIDENTGLISWTPTATGDYNVTVQAANSEGTDTQPFTINVAAAPVCPTDMTHYWKLDETAGSPYQDYYGSNDATCTDCPAATAGIINVAQQFNGSSDEVDAADDDTFDWSNSQSFSIEFWSRTTSDCDGNEVIVGRDDGATSLHWWVGCADWLDDSAVFVLVDNDGNTGEVDHWPQSSSPMNDGAWHHFVAVRDAAENEIRLYVDGVEEDSSSATYSTGFEASSTALNIGYLQSGDYNYDGTLDEVALYDRALSAGEIQGHYNAGTGRSYCEPYAPEIISTAVTQAFVGWPYSYDVEATGNPVPTYTLTVFPTGMTIDENTGEISWTPTVAGDYDVTVQATSSEGMDTQPFTINVAEPPSCPLEMISYHKLDESAAPYTDYLGGPDATCVNCPTAMTGLVNGAQHFNGSDDEVNVVDENQFDWAADDSFTIEYWMKKSTPCTGNEVIVGRDDGSLHWWTGCQADGTVRFQLRDVDGNGAYIGGSGDVINNGEWHHLVFVRDESLDENRIYVDGVQTHDATHDYTAGFGSNVALNIGYLNLSDHYRYDGDLDEVALYDKALTTAEIEQHYNAGLAGQAYCEVGPAAPEITSDPVTQAFIGLPYSYDVDASGNPAPTYTLTISPTGMTIDQDTGEISWTPTAAGDYAVTVQATNSEGTDSQPFTITVTAAGPCPADMLSYWRLDETSGSIFTDYYGDNDGACAGVCPSPTTDGKVNGGQVFDRSLQTGIDVPADASFDWGANDSFSIEYWMKGIPGVTCAGSGTSNNEVIVGRDDSDTDLHWWFGCVNTTGNANFRLGDTSGDGVALDGPPINDGQWHHLVGVRDGANGVNRLYVDGVEVDSELHTYLTGFDSATAALNLGWLNLPEYYHFNGTLDEVSLYDRALSDTEIKTHYYLARGYCETCATPVRIMPLGDSITYDNHSGETRPEGERISYRMELWYSLMDAGYNVDFVGSQSAGYDIVPPFDPDNEGWPGWQDDEIASHIYGWLQGNPADVILLHIGTNGLNASPDDVEDILDEIDRYEADYGLDITVLLARIINRISYSQTTTDFNDNVEAMAELRIADGDRIIIVDMEDGAGLVYTLDTTPPYDNGDMWDNLHPNDDGYTKMADVWLHGDSFGSDGLADFVPVCAPPTPVSPTITSEPVTEAFVSWSYSYDVEASGNPPPTYTLTVFPTGMTIDQDTGEISWTPTATGDYDVTVQATNSEGSDTQPFTITVAETPDCPDDMLSYWKLDETSGSTYYDFYNGNDANCSAGHCPDSTTGIVDGALDFDGTGDYLTVPDDDSLDWASDDSFSIEVWANLTNCDDRNKVMIGRDNRPGGVHWWMGCQINTQTAVLYLIDTSNDGVGVYGTTPINDGEWHHIVAVRDESTNQNLIYVDGVLEGAVTHNYLAGFDATTTLGIGYMAYTGIPDYYYDGLLDEIALYNRALSEAEIAQHHQAGLAGQGYCETPGACLFLTKEASASVVRVGDTITYTYNVLNSGGVTLDPVTLVDDQLGDIITASDGISLAATESIVRTATYTVQESDLPGPIVNIATASGTPEGGDPVTNAATASVELISPSIEVVKTAAPTEINAGDLVTYTYWVTNNGDVPLAGVTLTDDRLGPIALAPARVTDGLQALYTFEEGSDTTVHDVSGVGAPLDLTVEDAAAASWIPGGGLSINSSTIVASAGAATKIVDASQASDEISIEAWIQPANTTQDGPARIVTLSDGALLRNFTLAQQESDYDTRLRTTATSDNGIPSLTAGTVAVSELSHVVYTRDTSGVARFYVNGVEVGSRNDITGDFSTWDDGFRFGLANEFGTDRTWLGEYHLVAIYDQALSQAEVSQNLAAQARITLLPGESISTTVSIAVTEDVTNTATAEATDTLGGTVSDEDTAFVDVLPTITVVKSADPTSVVEPGGSVDFTARVNNTSAEPVTLTSLVDDVHGDLDGQGDCSVPQIIPAGGYYECIFSADVTGNAGDSETDTVTATANDDENNVVEAEDDATVTITDAEPTITVVKSADPTSVVEPGGSVDFTARVNNTSIEPVTLTSLVDDVHGDLDGQGDCSAPQTIPAGGYYECAFSADVTGNAGDSETDTVTATVQDNENNVVEANDDATVTITDAEPTITVVKTAEPTSVIEPGGSVDFTARVNNTSVEPVTLTSLVDDIHGDLDGQGDCSVPQTIPAGGYYECTFSADVTGNAGDSETDTVTATANDDENNVVEADDDATVTITDAEPTITVVKSADPTSVVEPGGSVDFTARVNNTSVEPVTLTALVDDIHGDLDGQGDCSVPQTIPAGGYYECTFSADVTGNAGDSETDTVTATANDDENNVVEADDDATVTITDAEPTITVVKTADPTSVVEPGGSVDFTARVNNTSVEPVTLTSLVDDIHGDLDGQGDCSAPQTIPAGGYYECTFSADVTGNAGDSETDTVTATANDDENNVVEADDDATVTITDVLPTIGVSKTADPTVVRAGDSVDFTMRVYNYSVEPVTLTDLNDTVFGDLATECGLPVDIAVGDFFECVISRAISADHTNTVTATAGDDEGNTVTDSADASVDVINPSIQVVKAASVITATVGETITYTYTVENTGDVTLTDISASDDQLGAISLGSATLAPGEITTGIATHLVDDIDLPGPIVNVVTVIATPPLGAQVSDTDTATVHIEPAPAPEGSTIYLPIIMNNSAPSAPDLVVESILVTSDNARVVIRNQGNAPVLSSNTFWVDLYINPDPVPTGVNQVWDGLCDEGIVWGIIEAALPLEPGDVLTLTLGDAYYWPEHSDFSGSLPAGTPVYAQVDSANTESTHGAVLENHELANSHYNNITGPVFSTVSAPGIMGGGQPGQGAQSIYGGYLPSWFRRLPRRP